MPLPQFPTSNTNPDGTKMFRLTNVQRRASTPVLLKRFGGANTEQRSLVADREFSFWSTVQVEADAGGVEQIDDFVRDRNGSFESFLWLDPVYYQRNNGGPGKITLTGGPTVWNLPSSGEGAGDYPETSGHQLYDDGSPISSTVDQDARTFTTASISGVITVDYDFRLRVRFVPGTEPNWSALAGRYNLYGAQFQLEEVVA
jgi:hypothetical protein